jgi:hypothetical protein
MNALKRKCAAATAMGMLLCSPVRAENILESLFHLMSHPDQARAASSSNAMTLTVHRHDASKAHARHMLKAQADHKTDRPVLAANEKYLSSASFSQKFRASPETGQNETREAIRYLVAHDGTLRRGDALVTQNGVVVFNPDRSDTGAFVPVNDRHVEKPLQKRLTGFQPGASYGSNMAALTAQSGDDTASGVAADKPDATADQKIQTADGRIIRFVGGSVSLGSAALSNDGR